METMKTPSDDPDATFAAPPPAALSVIVAVPVITPSWEPQILVISASLSSFSWSPKTWREITIGELPIYFTTPELYIVVIS